MVSERLFWSAVGVATVARGRVGAVLFHPRPSVRWSPEPPGAAGALGVPLPGLLALDARVPFVARPSEWDVLEGAWSGTRTGTCRAVLVGGDAVSGKTRLVSEFARAAHRRGGTILFGACTEDVEVPYQPFVQALTHALENLTAELREELVTAHGAILGNLLPTGVAPDTSDPTDHDGDTERYRLFEAVASLLGDLARRALPLVLDDMHWARRPTVSVTRPSLALDSTRRCACWPPSATCRSTWGEPYRGAAGPTPPTGRGPPHSPGSARLGCAFTRQWRANPVDASLEPLVSHLMASTDGNAFSSALWRHLVEVVGCLVQVDEVWSLAAPLSARAARKAYARSSAGASTRSPRHPELLGRRRQGCSSSSMSWRQPATSMTWRPSTTSNQRGRGPAPTTPELPLPVCPLLVRDAAEDVLSPTTRRRTIRGRPLA